MERPQYHLELDDTLSFADGSLADILAYWDKKRAGRDAPGRADLDPLEMSEHLGWITLTDVIGRPPRFRYRLIGTEVTRRIGRDSTGRFLDEVYHAEDYEGVVAPFRWLIEHRRPLRAFGRLWFAARDWLTFEVLHLPLAKDGTTIDMIMTRNVIR